jgi:hypothetical protein
MAIHVSDPRTDEAVRRLAARWGLSLTETIQKAVEAQLDAPVAHGTVAERTFALRQRLRAMPDCDMRPLQAIRDDWNE